MSTAVAAQVKERPLIFSGHSVRSIMDGRKTQTRRVIKGIDSECDGLEMVGGKWQMLWNKSRQPEKALLELCNLKCPHGKAGDQIWVRESWNYTHELMPEERDQQKGSLLRFQEGRVSDIVSAALELPTGTGSKQPLYAADFDDWAHHVDSDLHWRNPMFMPRWASRITLEITDVRVQRLQEITEEDAIAEGCKPEQFPSRWPNTTISLSARANYKVVWDRLNGKKYPWDLNHFVWAITFRKITR